MMTRDGRFATEHASKYLQQLCKHFAHKVDATCDETTGRVAFPMGPAELRASATELVVTVSGATPEDLDRGSEVIDSHLERFAFREGFKNMVWAA